MSGRRLFILDLRSLQHRAADASGVGGLTADLVRSARRNLMNVDEIEILGLVDRARPDLDRDIRDHLDGLRYNGYVPNPRPFVFVQFAPNIGDPLIVGRILNSAEVFKAAIVDDGASLELPESPSRRLADEIDHRTKFCWLARYDHFYPMSRHAAERIGTVLGVGTGRMTLLQDEHSTRIQIDEICHTFWRDLEARTGACPAAPMIGGARPKIAVLSLLPPHRSDSTATTNAIFAEMSTFAELHAFTPTPSPAVPVGATATNPLSAFPFLSRRFDRVVAVTGNTFPHHGIFELLMRYGGACIQHDVPSTHSYLRWSGESHTREVAEQELGRPLALGELERWLTDDTTRDASFLSELASQASPLCVHSKVTVGIVQDRFNVAATYLPRPGFFSGDSDVRTAVERNAARTRLGISTGDIVLVAFGTLASATAPEDIIWALSMLRDWGLRTALYFVGDIAMNITGLRALSESLGLGDHVRFVLAVPSDTQYRDFLCAADLAVHLRAGKFAGPTATLIDCIAVGIPTIVTRSVQASIDAPSYVTAIQDDISPVLVAEALANEHGAQASAQLREQERTAFQANHCSHTYAQHLAAALSLDPALRHARP